MEILIIFSEITEYSEYLAAGDCQIASCIITDSKFFNEFSYLSPINFLVSFYINEVHNKNLKYYKKYE